METEVAVAIQRVPELSNYKSWKHITRCRRFTAPLFQLKFSKRHLVPNGVLIWKTPPPWLRVTQCFSHRWARGWCDRTKGYHSLNEPPGYNVRNATRPLWRFWREIFQMAVFHGARVLSRTPQAVRADAAEFSAFQTSPPRRAAPHALKWLTHGRKCCKLNLILKKVPQLLLCFGHLCFPDSRKVFDCSVSSSTFCRCQSAMQLRRYIV